MCIRKVFMERWSKSDQNGLDLINFPKESYRIEILFDMSYWSFEAYECMNWKLIKVSILGSKYLENENHAENTQKWNAHQLT